MRLASIFIFLSGVSKRDEAYSQNVTIIFLFLENKQQKKKSWAIQYYFELGDNEIFQQLEDSSKGDFYIWNSTSLGNLFVAASGYNGIKVRIQAIDLLISYVGWYKDRYKMRLCLRPPWIFPEGMEEIQILEKTLEFVVKNRIEERDLELLKNYQERFGLLDKLCDVI